MLSRTRSEDCLSDLRLDELSAGELTESERTEALAHLDGCELCPERLAALDGTRARIGGSKLPPLRGRSAPRRWGPALGVAVAVAAVVSFFVVPRRAPPPTRTKGVSQLGFFVTGAEGTRIGAPGETVHPGDTLTFTVSAAAPTHVAILSRDGAGKASVYHPEIAVAAGRGTLLPTATLLDGTLGSERIVAVICDAAVEAEPLRAALAARGELPPLPEGCHAETVTIEKVE